MIAATEKLDVVVALVKMEVDVAAALGAFQPPGEHLGSCVTVAFCAVYLSAKPEPFPKSHGQ